jgi:YesN/AraC family two-component response regulator
MADISALRFLVVDDELFIRKLEIRIIQQMGAVVVNGAADGQEALDQLKTADQPPDVMLVDLTMPGMGGAQLLRELASVGYKGAVILVSGADEETLAFAQGLAQHHDVKVLGFIVKPLKPEALKAMLDKLA